MQSDVLKEELLPGMIKAPEASRQAMQCLMYRDCSEEADIQRLIKNSIHIIGDDMKKRNKRVASAASSSSSGNSGDTV